MSASRRASHHGARLAILVVGAVGLAVAGRTAAFYLGVDRVAFGLSLLIAAGLLGGIVELLGRVTRVERTLAELARLPRPATLEAIDASSPALRSVLRARLTGVRASVPTVGFASYLVGLLVMVGLLGTFLGLVEALRGAREALGASNDIDALRAALTTPMLGLSRAFGTSAAGLSASAMLGLAAIFARRTEVSLAHAVHAYGDETIGPLTVAERQLTMADRQLVLIEALVQQSAASSAAAARATEAALATAAAVRADLAAGVADVAHAVERTLTPALERAVERASEVTRERLDDWTRVVARESDERRARDAELARAWADLAGESAERVAREGERVLVELRAALGESLAALDGRLGASVELLTGRLGTSVDALSGQLAARTTMAFDELELRTTVITEELTARLAALTTSVAALVQGLSGELDGTRLRLDRTLEATIQALEAHAERTVTRERARDEALDARHRAREEALDARERSREEAIDLRERSREETNDARERSREEAMDVRVAELAAAEARALTRLERHVDTVDTALATHLERMTAMQLDANREAMRQAAALEAVLHEHAAGLTTRTGEVLSEAARRAEAATAAAERVVGATAAATERVVDAASVATERVVDAASVATERVVGAAAVATERAVDAAAAAAERVVGTARDEMAAREASERAHAARVEASELAQATRAEESLRAQTERAGAAELAHAARAEAAERANAARVEATERASAARVEAVLAGLSSATAAITERAGSVLDAQAARQAELEDRLLAAHEASAARLLALLTQHTGGLAQELSSTQALVDDAAGLLRASGVEMGAVAEVFTAAVDRYRDASAASLQALTGLDDAVDRAGKKAAIDLLTDYLDQTREVFEHSLEVQRELFAELRALRTRGQSSAPEAPRVRA